ncbi:MAG TPA: divalent-cation tolerance protein CutA [Ktedonobacteraceae bacterium]|nr:divalent-cation tolerance protein CutA [Ktedonobacteraceae bacterium]
MSEIIEIHTTIDSRDAAQKLAEAVVSKRLAACAQVSGPIMSIYWWQGKIERDQEWLCVMKTRRELYPAVEQAIREAHPYDEPEILAYPMIAGSNGYLAWVERETQEETRA